jgi:hypothetical protein
MSPGHISEQTGRPVPVDQHREDHLPQVRTVILAVSVPARGLSAGASVASSLNES